MTEETLGQERKIQVQVDATNMETVYANAFQANATPEEVFISFGINQMMQPQSEDQPAKMMLKLDKRVVLNPHSAKRLAIQLSQVIRQHEQQFGPLELDVAKRSNTPQASPNTPEAT